MHWPFVPIALAFRSHCPTKPRRGHIYLVADASSTPTVLVTTASLPTSLLPSITSIQVDFAEQRRAHRLPSILRQLSSQLSKYGTLPRKCRVSLEHAVTRHPHGHASHYPKGDTDLPPEPAWIVPIAASSARELLTSEQLELLRDHFTIDSRSFLDNFTITSQSFHNDFVVISRSFHDHFTIISR